MTDASLPRAEVVDLDAWLRCPLPGDGGDPRLQVRRVHPDEFDRFYDMVDEAFRVRRPRPEYRWLYTDNPNGVARCLAVVERATGRFVGGQASRPWPLAHGRTPLIASLSGDTVVVPEWQGKGVSRLRIAVRDTHPMERAAVRFGWANAITRGAMRKGVIDGHVAGPVPCRGLVLNVAAPLIRRGWPPALAAVTDRIAAPAVRAWSSLALRGESRGRVEPVRRFDARADRVTERCATWDGYWCPHDAAFLNWRYLDHPTREYVAIAVLDDDEMLGYCVVGFPGQVAWLMELVVAPASPEARALVRRAVGAARDAGCAVLMTSAPPRWPHWRLLRSAGFLPMPVDIFFFTSSMLRPDVQPLDHWQFVPGDMDFV